MFLAPIFANHSHAWLLGRILPIHHVYSCPLVHQNVYTPLLYSHFYSTGEVVQDSYLRHDDLYLVLGGLSPAYQLFTMVRYLSRVNTNSGCLEINTVQPSY